MARATRLAGLLLALALPRTAAGQEEGGEPPEPAPSALVEEAREHRGTVEAEVGLRTYAGEAARLTVPGLAYGVSVGLELGSGVGAELGYVGAIYGLEGASQSVSENGGRLLAKVGPRRGRQAAYGLLGLEVTLLNVSHARSSGGVQDATMVRLPLGAGLDWAVANQGPTEIVVGLRAQYLFTLRSGAFPELAGSNAANQFAATALVGAFF